jgi:glycosyltransferase involved in cell wall biosynthesis
LQRKPHVVPRLLACDDPGMRPESDSLLTRDETSAVTREAWATPALPPRVGLNAIFLEPRMGGLDTYVRALVPELVRLAPEVRFSVFCNPRGRDYLEREGWGDSVELVTHPLLGRRGLKAISELTVLGAIAGRRVDLLHSAGMTAPLRTGAVNVVTLADVTWIVAPEPDEAGTVRLWRLIVPPVARRADRVLALSEAGAEHLVRYLRVPRERIDVVPLASGGSDLLTPTPAPELRARLGLGEGPVVLTVSAKKANKNLARLVRAMVGVLAHSPDAVLVMPGNPTPHERELRRLAEELGLTANVVFPEYVDAADLEGLYALASCFVFASINEGFGIPILEAMRRNVPVACSRASALPEVAGDAARYFDPYDVQDISNALVELLEDRELATELAVRGRRREAQFTWEASARGTLESYSRAWAASR